ncbi:hypothetical protein EPUL_001864 [Erysiphe pulchra]|uniref:Amino acid permease/ SLC12A domain-containing protein n=1 Tax=Erysiphe pulchra TaxID=225359 RepID=A0A2S4PV67_9PEZI|nr:hypothetical protein EPUL_001864 [Erysiphe pulchra]
MNTGPKDAYFNRLNRKSQEEACDNQEELTQSHVILNVQSHLSSGNLYNEADTSASNRCSTDSLLRRQDQGSFRYRKNGSASENKPATKRWMTEYGTLKIEKMCDRNKKNSSATVPNKSSSSKEIKLGMFSGVFVPTCLNVLSILMFLRFGFLLGQAGFLGIMGMLIASYLINLVTTFSLSAIASNGTVRGGGAYYLISRSLGPEFGGSIGLIFYLGLVFNTGLNAVGLIDCIKLNFGKLSGNWAQILPESPWYLYLWATFVLLACTGVCFAGSSLFSRASNALLVILIIATLSIPLSAFLVAPYQEESLGIDYTGISWSTFINNLKPHLTKGAAGSQLRGRETFQDLFGILFPATGGIFAGASMSGDLKNPSKSIPKGTLYGLGTTFILYAIVIITMASTVTRASFIRNANIIQDTNISGLVVLAGELASALFSTLMGVIGSAKLLQALARDNILPGFSIFSQGTKNGDEPSNAIIFTYLIAQITMLCDLNQIASFITMTYLEHVKFWRPQILLFVNDPRRQYKLIQFCNSIKKGSLYILGHIIVSDDFGSSVPEARRQQAAWSNYIDFSKIKAFVNISISNGIEWGARNIVLSAGLGGMRPNIAVLGFYNLDDLSGESMYPDFSQYMPTTQKLPLNTKETLLKGKKLRKSSKDTNLDGALPTDSCKTEGMISITSYVTILEDLLLRLQINVAVAKGFRNLEFPSKKDNSKKYIDLWPIQMSAEIATGGVDKQNVLTTNFDTYTLILQLGAILNTVPAWKKSYKLRVLVFVEYESDVEEERGRVESLLENLRIKAEVLVFWLASGDIFSYEIIVNGAHLRTQDENEVDECLKGQDWWDELQKIRGKRGPSPATEKLSQIVEIFKAGPTWPDSSFQQGPRGKIFKRFGALRKILKKSRAKRIISGASLAMHTHKLPEELVKSYSDHTIASEDSALSSDDESDEDSSQSAASENDAKDFDSEDEDILLGTTKLRRWKSCNDTVPRPVYTKKQTIQKSFITDKSLDLDALGEVDKGHDHIHKVGEREGPVISQPATSLEKTQEIKTQLQNQYYNGINQIMAKSRQEDLIPTSQSTSQSMSRHASQPKFSSKPVPISQVATEDGPGPSIMFTSTSPPSRARSRLPSAYSPSSHAPINTQDLASRPFLLSEGSSYSTQNLPLSFNDLPRSAQHLILNELIRLNSKETVVMFTTLPSPVEGTCLNNEASAAYLKDLETFCKDCPPVMMVHSNSMTVTMSL